MSSLSSSNLPPADPGVFFATASAIIDAPIDDVWAMLLDFPRYPDWNPFGLSQTVVDSRGVPLADQTARAGAECVVVLADQMTPARGLRFRIAVLDHAAHRVAWASAYDHWFFGSERWEALSVVDDGGEARTLYETRQVFSGVFAYAFKWASADSTLQRGFEKTAIALKKRAEAA